MSFVSQHGGLLNIKTSLDLQNTSTDQSGHKEQRRWMVKLVAHVRNKTGIPEEEALRTVANIGRRPENYADC